MNTVIFEPFATFNSGIMAGITGQGTVVATFLTKWSMTLIMRVSYSMSHTVCHRTSRS